MLFILVPLTFVLGSIDVDVFAEAMRLVIDPLPLIVTSVAVDQPPTAIRHVVLPLPREHGTVCPLLRAVAFAESLLIPSANVHCFVIEFERAP